MDYGVVKINGDVGNVHYDNEDKSRPTPCNVICLCYVPGTGNTLSPPSNSLVNVGYQTGEVSDQPVHESEGKRQYKTCLHQDKEA